MGKRSSSKVTTKSKTRKSKIKKTPKNDKLKIELIDTIINQEKEKINLFNKISNSGEEKLESRSMQKKSLKNNRGTSFSDEDSDLHQVNRKHSKSTTSVDDKPTNSKSTTSVDDMPTNSKFKSPVAYLQRHKLKKLLDKLNNPIKPNRNQNELKKCLAHMHPAYKQVWTLPCYVMKAVNDCLLTRNWNALTYLLLELIHYTTEMYKPLIRHVFSIMDKLHPVIYENDLQGEFLKIKKYHQKILNDTTVV